MTLHNSEHSAGVLTETSVVHSHIDSSEWIEKSLQNITDRKEFTVRAVCCTDAAGFKHRSLRSVCYPLMALTVLGTVCSETSVIRWHIINMWHYTVLSTEPAQSESSVVH